MIPIFPLNVILLPGETLTLHIFEPRYKKLIEACKHEGQNFGICLSFKGKLSRFGTEVKLHKVLKNYFDGSSDIVVKGIRSFQILRYEADNAQEQCDLADVRYVDLFEDKLVSESLWLEYQEYIEKYIGSLIQKSKLSCSLIEIARSAGLSTRQKDRYIAMKSREQREKLLFNQLRYMLFIQEQEASREFNLLMN